MVWKLGERGFRGFGGVGQKTIPVKWAITKGEEGKESGKLGLW